MKIIRKMAYMISENSVFFRTIFRKTSNFIKKIKYKLATIGIKVDDKTIVFCTFNGKSYSCSPKALYEYMVNNDKYSDFKFIWGFKNVEQYKYLENNKNTSVIKLNTKQYIKYLAKAKYWIFNYKIPDYLYPKKSKFLYNVGMVHH